MAVEKVEHVASVETDMNAHTVTVTFDDAKTSLSTIEAALNEAGYMVRGKQQLN